MTRLVSTSPQQLSEIARLIQGRVCGLGDLRVGAIVNHHGEWQPGDLFLATRGTARDSHECLGDLVARSAGSPVAAIVDRDVEIAGLCTIVVSDTRLISGIAAGAFVSAPARQMRMTAVTGTNGKTTTNWLVHGILREHFGGSLRIGTLGTRVERQGDQTPVYDSDTGLTTPDPLALAEACERAATVGVGHGVMETSSHALDQSRVNGIHFESGIFTNLTRDHLDYHGTMERYRDAKMKLFSLIQEGGAAVIHRDTAYGEEFFRFAQARGSRDLSFGRSETCQIVIRSFVQSAAGSVLLLSDRSCGRDQQVTIRSAFIGEHNAENLAAAYGAGRALEIAPDELSEILSHVSQVPGRLEAVGTHALPVFVDYAHTPDALERALQALRPLTTGQLWVVFGCGGDRDRGKRPQMAKVAEHYADRVVITSDNPRTEDPCAILGDIAAGSKRDPHIEVDRAKAIHLALTGASSGDVILIAGKGHEDYQIIGTTKHHFSDQEVVREVLQQRVG